jgi:hypothetical protein
VISDILTAAFLGFLACTAVWMVQDLKQARRLLRKIESEIDKEEDPTLRRLGLKSRKFPPLDMETPGEVRCNICGRTWEKTTFGELKKHLVLFHDPDAKGPEDRADWK